MRLCSVRRCREGYGVRQSELLADVLNKSGCSDRQLHKEFAAVNDIVVKVLPSVVSGVWRRGGMGEASCLLVLGSGGAHSCRAVASFLVE